jgi:hypothetical protein
MNGMMNGMITSNADLTRCVRNRDSLHEPKLGSSGGAQ